MAIGGNYDPDIKLLLSKPQIETVYLVIFAEVGEEGDKVVWFKEQAEMLKEKWGNDLRDEKRLKIYCVLGNISGVKPVWIR